MAFDPKVDILYVEAFGDTPPTIDSFYVEIFGSPDMETLRESAPPSGMSLFIHGHLPANSGISLYIQGNEPRTSGIPLFIHGDGVHNSGIPLYIHGQAPDSGARTLYIHGVGTSTDGITLYIGDLGKRIENTIPLYLHNGGVWSGVPLVIWGSPHGGGDGNDGWYSAEGQMNLFIRGAGIEASMPLYMNAPTGTINNSMPLYIVSNEVSTSNMNLYIDSYDTKTNTLRLYSHGF